MKTAHLGPAALALGLLLLVLSPAALSAQEPVSKDKIIGTWDMEVLADGQTFYLVMVLTETEGRLEGKIGEQSGFFSDIPLASLNYDGQTLTFDFSAPTPPDGLPRQILNEFAWNGSDLEGTVTLPDLGMTIPAKAVKKA